MKKILCILIVSLLILPVLTWADLDITVKYNRGWGDAPTSNIKKLCENVLLHFQEQFREEHKIDGKLKIVYRAEGPIAFYRSYFGGAADEYQVGLTVTDTYWAQFSYQFGHELCHVLTDHERITKNNPNKWFHEALCELGTLWVIQRMGETWAYRAPYPNWVGWRHNLTNYANDLANRAEVDYTGTGAEWLEQWENTLREEDNAFSYARVSQLSYKFLPIFEEHPEAWNIIRQMPATTSKMAQYMKDWHRRVDSEDKHYVEEMADIMGISVDIPGPVVTATLLDADVNDDGYVDLSDVLIVRSGMQNSVMYDTDVNDDGITNEIDLLLVKAKAVEAIIAASPRKQKIRLTTWGALKRK